MLGEGCVIFLQGVCMILNSNVAIWMLDDISKGFGKSIWATHANRRIYRRDPNKIEGFFAVIIINDATTDTRSRPAISLPEAGSVMSSFSIIDMLL